MLTAIAGLAPVPRVIAFCEDCDGARATVHRHRANRRCLDHDELPTAYPPGAATLARIGEELVDTLAAIHAIDWSALDLAPRRRRRDYTRSQVERWLAARGGRRARAAARRRARALAAREPAPSAAGPHRARRLPPRQHAVPRRCAAPGRGDRRELSTVGDPFADLGLVLMFWGPRPVPSRLLLCPGRQPGSRGAVTRRRSPSAGRS